MPTFVLRRLLVAIPTLLALIVISFVLMFATWRCTVCGLSTRASAI